jgi:Flp pilus assembly protein TadG
MNVSQGRPARGFWSSDAGIAATEFVMLSPILMMLSVVSFDAGRYVLATQRVEAVANSIAEMLAQTGGNSASVEPGDGTVTDADLTYFQDSAMFTFPDALAAANSLGVNWRNLLVVNMASVKFTATPAKCASNCTYAPQVVWSTGWRKCGAKIVAAPDASGASPTTLPGDLFGVDSQIVVDVSYTFQPTFGASVLPSISIDRTAYLSPRNVRIVETSSSTLAPNCPGVL